MNSLARVSSRASARSPDRQRPESKAGFAPHRSFCDPYLNNNLHAAHHRARELPWYALPAFYARHRDALLADNGGLVYRGYGEVAARYLLRPHDGLVHSDHG